MFNIVLVGPGLIGKKHAQLLQNNKKCNLVAVVAPDHQCNHSFAKENGIPIYHDLNDCLNHVKADGVIISSPNKFHFEQAVTCIEHNVPTLVEKPITASVEEGEKLVEISKNKNVPILVGHHRAHSPILEKSRSIIQSGKLGRLVSVTGSAQFFKPVDYFKAGPWRTQEGGGPILINLIHEIGNLRSLCGEISAVHAFASSAIRGFPVEDTVSINLRFSNGVLGNFLLSDTSACARSWEHTTAENPVYPVSLDEDCYIVTGTRGYLSIPTFKLRIYPDGVESSWLSPMSEDIVQFERKDPLECQLNHFIDVISGRSEPLVSAVDGLMNLKITDAISMSAKTGQVVYL